MKNIDHKEITMSPALSKKQRTAMAVAEHSPGKLFKRNRGMLSMSHQTLHDYAVTKEKGLPEKKKKNFKLKRKKGKKS